MSAMNVNLNTNMYSSYLKVLEARGLNGKSMAEALADEFAKYKETDEVENIQATNTAKKNYPSAVEDWKRRHPESASHVNGQVRRGKEVLRKNGVENVDRDSMTMDEYKQFFTALMNSIPYDSSQASDVNVWSITDKGWEQMKNDADYEAWVLGYTSEDRSFYNPWAAMPGYSARYHTEKFGASIDEHLGQSGPMKSSDKNVKDGEESWWDKRMKAMRELAKTQEEKNN